MMEQFTSVALIDLSTSVIVFSLLAFSAWGLGDWFLRSIAKHEMAISKLAHVLISLALGLGAIGQVVFISGLAGDAYQPKFFWPVLLLLFSLSIWRLIKNVQKPSARADIEPLDVKEVLIIALASVSSIIWLYGAMSFTTGSDVLTYHYPFVKEFIKLRHFGHIVTLPFGNDLISTYNPALVHMLFLVGKLLGDDRSANLINWLSQVVTLAAIYAFCRDFISRSAAFMAVAICLGFSVLFMYAIDVSNYTGQCVFMLTALYCIFQFNKTRSRRWLVVGGILMGFMISTKYYGLQVMMALCLILIFWNTSNTKERLKDLSVICITALIVYLPWPAYNLRQFGDPLYPILSHIELYKRLYFETAREDLLSPFMALAGYGHFWPNVFYYISLFIPIEHSYRYFGLSPILLIGLPCSLYYLIYGGQEKWRTANMLFVVSMTAYLATEVSTRLTIWYKFGIYAGILYAISLSCIFNSWKAKSKRWIWSAVILVAVLNTFFMNKYIVRGYLFMPPVWDQAYLWTPVVKYLNENVEKGAGVANQDMHTNYYLRSDIRGLPSNGSWYSTDWGQEETLIRSRNIQYYVYDKNEMRKATSFYRKLIDLLYKRSSYDKAEAVRKSMMLYLARTDKLEVFLRRFGRPVMEFPDGMQIYRLYF